jgi:hypothetical protein
MYIYVKIIGSVRKKEMAVAEFKQPHAAVRNGHARPVEMVE